MPKFTEEQQLAIDTENSNILVSAGAGSGKTAVLTERVIRKIKNGVHINELLILTFTNKAAQEMKERIRNKLIKENLKEELQLIDTSYVTTFDSYALSLVKKYADVIHLSKNIKITDDTILNLKKEELLDDIFLSYYENPTKKFQELITNFCLKTDKNLKAKILELNNKLDLILDKEKYLKDYLNSYYSKENINNLIREYLNLVMSKKDLIIDTYEELCSVSEDKYLENLIATFKDFINTSNYDEIKKIGPLKLPNARLKGTDPSSKELRETLKKLLDEFNSITSYDSLNDITLSFQESKDYIGVIVAIILKLEEKFTHYKLENNYFTFMDIEKLAIKLVRDYQEVNLEVKNSFNEILIDEYQDTNDIQEEFVNLIAHNNVYMVGDIKQSIYRFRNANPALFKTKYDNYKENKGGKLIDLTKNFRSRKEVIDDINLFFDHIMDDKLGGATYTKGHEMIFGNMTYQESAKVDIDTNMEIYTYDSNNHDFKKEEQEAFLIGNDIKKKINSHYLVYDKDTDKLRQLEYRDIVILLDRSTNFFLFKQVFEYLQIPIVIYEDEKTSGSFDLALLKNIFIFAKHLILNQKDTLYKKSFTSLARSFLFAYSDQEIYDVLTTNKIEKTSIYEAFKEVLTDYEILTPKAFLQKILAITNYEEHLLTLTNINVLSHRMEYFYNLIGNLESANYTIIDIADYLLAIEDKKLEIKLSINKSDSNSVKIMTIHKSKGLEYPICYFANFYKDFNKQDLNNSVLFDQHYGIIIPDFNANTNLITKTLLKDKIIKEDISEKIRLLYVALTRAREKMIIVMPQSEEEVDINGLVSDMYRLNYTNFAKMVISVKSLFANRITNFTTIPDITKDYLKVQEIKKLKSHNSSLDIINSNYRKGEVEKEVYHEEKMEKKDKQELDLLKEGDKIHSLFERIDYDKGLLPKTTDKFIKDKLEKFYNNPFMQSLQSAKKYKEYEFIYEKNNKTYHGKIDLLLVFDTFNIIIDYKLKNTNSQGYINQLIGYKEVIETKTKKPCQCYLYSIIDNKFVKIC